MVKRKRHSAELKAKVALEALKGERTLSELSARYNVHPNLITKWKKQAREGLVDVFSGGARKRDDEHERRIKELHEKIGQLTVEKDFLSKAFDR